MPTSPAPGRLSGPYRVGIAGGGAQPDGTTMFGDIGLDRLTAAGIEWEVMAPAATDVPPVEAVAPYDAVLSMGHMHVTRELVAAAPRLLHVARFGAGYDGIDVAGLTAEGVVLTNTPAAVRRPLAVAGLTLLLAVSHRLLENHRAATSGRWEDRGQFRGAGLDGRTVGIVGLGGVGSELAGLLAPFGVRLIAASPSRPVERAAALGVELVDLDRLAAESDYVVLTAALTPASHHLVDETFLRAMRPTAYLVNVGRGALVDQRALTAALVEGRIAGAGLDVLDPEPPDPADPLLALGNVVVTPHTLCHTAEFSRDVAADALGAILDVAHGRRPADAVDPGVLDHWRRGRRSA